MADAYRRAGVDLDAAARAVQLIREAAGAATREEVVAGVGGFAALVRLGGGRLLAAATDGVGTKLELARRAGRLSTVGIDLVAMCANDVVCTGAEPLAFLDYLAVGRLDPERAAEVVAGIAEGCRRAGCALVGGETAEHPGVLADDRLDLAGFCVGLVNETELLGPHRVQEGDALVGLPANGLHANGFSLVRRIVDERRLDLDSVPGGLTRPLVDELLDPTPIYVRPVLEAARTGAVRAAAHITGGGLVENLPRALPSGLGVDLDRGSWPVPPIIPLIQREGGLDDDEMARTFNGGLGLVLVVAPEGVDTVRAAAEAGGVSSSVVGKVSRRGGVRSG